MAIGYTKLFTKILDSTIWMEDDKTRIVWLTLLAMVDKNGIVDCPLPALANRARVDLESCKAAIDKFLAPDEYSRTPDYEGRRIEKVEGGWLLLNHAKYRRMLSDEQKREYKAEWATESRLKDKLKGNKNQ